MWGRFLLLFEWQCVVSLRALCISLCLWRLAAMSHVGLQCKEMSLSRFKHIFYAQFKNKQTNKQHTLLFLIPWRFRGLSKNLLHLPSPAKTFAIVKEMSSPWRMIPVCPIGMEHFCGPGWHVITEVFWFPCVPETIFIRMIHGSYLCINRGHLMYLGEWFLNYLSMHIFLLLSSWRNYLWSFHYTYILQVFLGSQNRHRQSSYLQI